MVKLIAVCGFKRSGKDTIADFLVRQYGYHKISIADPLKDACKVLFGFTHEQINGQSKDIPSEDWYNLTPRQILQFFGTEMMQFRLQELMPKCGRMFWIKRMCKEIDGRKLDKIVVPDVRFVHEYNELIKVYGVKNVEVIKVSREICGNSGDLHVSETEWQKIEANYFVSNNDTVNALFEKIDNIMKKI